MREVTCRPMDASGRKCGQTEAAIEDHELFAAWAYAMLQKATKATLLLSGRIRCGVPTSFRTGGAFQVGG